MAKVLIVEDNEMNLNLITRRLTKRGFEIHAAMTEQEALDQAKTVKPDLILMDLRLEEKGGLKDGRDVTRKIKADPETQAIPVIALTAEATATERETALEAGCDDYHSKPIDLSRLLEQMNALLPGESS
ncbi:Polar-differentiation response regulator DivK [Planctomycetales bacterium 10988]|nr:Polar-differentiation response regulator DivK [Planctomycetales bacterium 10988]